MAKYRFFLSLSFIFGEGIAGKIDSSAHDSNFWELVSFHQLIFFDAWYSFYLSYQLIYNACSVNFLWSLQHMFLLEKVKIAYLWADCSK